MRTALVSLIALAAAGAALPAAAQTYQPLAQRQAELDARIDGGVRSGDLTRAEATRLRAEYRDLITAESRYRANDGRIDARERADLDRRFDLLSARVRYERQDEQDRGGEENDFDARQDRLSDRIDRNLARNTLTRAEAQSLRGELRALIRLEAQYERTGSGIEARERRDLERRYDLLAERLREERRDDDRDDIRDDRMDYVPLDQRRAELEQRISNATRSGQLTVVEGFRIRAEFALLTRTENSYRASGGGLDANEQAELQRRYDALSNQIRDERRDNDRRY